MSRRECIQLLTERGVQQWNAWRAHNPGVRPDLSEMRAPKSSLPGANFSYANLSRANLRRADLRGADLSYSTLSRAYLVGANLHEVNMRGARLEDADLRGAYLSCADLSDAHCTRTNFADANLADADLTNCRIIGSDFRVESLVDANLDRALLSDLIIPTEETSNNLRSILELTRAKNLAKANFGSPEFLVDYLEKAFRYAHQTATIEGSIDMSFVRRSVDRLNVLRKVYFTAEWSPEAVQQVQLLSRDLALYVQSHPRDLFSLGSRQFEIVIAELLESFGWNVELTPEVADGGYDIFAITSDAATGVKTSWIIECKRYAEHRKVGVSVARQLYAVKAEQRVANAMLVTTSGFTKGVERFQASRWDLV